MKNRRTIIIGVIVALCVCLAFGSRMYSRAEKLNGKISPAQSANDRKQMPDEVSYMFLFHHLDKVKDNDRGSKHYKDRTGLSDGDFDYLKNVASDHEKEVGKIDERAQILIDDYHAQYPPGRLPPGANPPLPPDQLKQLQSQRNQVTLRYRDKFLAHLKPDKTPQFQQFMEREFTPQNHQRGGN